MFSAFFSLRHGHSPRSLIFGGAALPPPSAAPQSVMEVQPGESMRMVLVLRLQRCGGDLLPGFFASTHAIYDMSFASSGSESVFHLFVLLLRDSRRFPLCSVSSPGRAPIGLLLSESLCEDVDECVFFFSLIVVFFILPFPRYLARNSLGSSACVSVEGGAVFFLSF